MRKLLIILFLLISTFAGATNYYVKNGGNDGAAGTSDGTAWATIAKVNSYGTSPGFSPGDTIFFNRGDTWRITTSDGGLYTRSGSVAGNVVYTSYGTGDKPLFMGSVEENSVDDWISLGSNLWRNADDLFATEVCNIIFDNESSIGIRVINETPNEQGEFSYDHNNDWITLYSTSHPTTYYTDIECVLLIYPGAIYLSGSRDYVTIDGIAIKYVGRHGIIMSSGVTNIDIRNCDISYVGGAQTSPTSTVRLGNGIENYGSCSDVLIENNYVAHTLDEGYTNQNFNLTGITISNLRVQNNIFYKCDFAMSFYHSGCTGTADGVYYENNTIVSSGYNWAYDQKYSNKQGCDFYLSHFTLTMSNFYIRNNISYGARNYAIRGTTTPQNAVATNITWDYNLYYCDVVAYLGSTTYTTLAQWQSYSGDDAHSLSDDPDFTSSTDFHLTAGSPAIDAGISVGIGYDYDGNLRDANPDIGAYEFGATEPEEPPPPVLPTVTTSSITINFSALTASGGGNVTDDGEGTVSARGVCWNTTVNPNTSHSKTTDGSGTGAFSSTLTDLVQGETYYVRAYATNEVGTAYGSNVSFTMSEGTIVYYNGKPVFYGGKPVYYGGAAQGNTLLNQLVAYWKFDETSGTEAADATGNGHTGTIVGATIDQEGKFGRCYSYDGINDGVTLSAIASGTSFAISVWIKPNSIVQDGCILQASNYQGFAVEGDGADANKINWYQPPTNTLSSSAMTDGVWNHAVISVSNGTGTFYINGAVAGTVTGITSTNFAYIGDIGTDEFKGMLDDMLLYSRSLTETEIDDLYNEGNGYQPL